MLKLILTIMVVAIAGYFGFTEIQSAWDDGTFKYLVGAAIITCIDLILLAIYIINRIDQKGAF